MKKCFYLLTLIILQAHSYGQNTFPATGNVGIGTSSPTYSLDINNSQNAQTQVRITNTNTGTNAFAGLQMVSQGGSSYLYRTSTNYVNPSVGNSTVLQEYSGGDIILYGAGEIARFKNGGNVGIGTSSPSYLLDVNGTTRIQSAGNDVIKVIASAATRGGVYVQNTNSASQATNYVDNDRGGFASYCGFLAGGSADVLPSIFGLSRSDRGFMIADGASNLGLGVGTLTAQPLVIGTNNAERIRIDAAGNVGIGISSPQSLLAVNGTITTKKVKVTQLNWPDYVFDSKYHLPTPGELEQYISIHKHLPGVISEEEVKKEGADLGDNQAALLQKIEELTLYMIQQSKEIELLKEENKKLLSMQDQLDQLKKLIRSTGDQTDKK